MLPLAASRSDGISRARSRQRKICEESQTKGIFFLRNFPVSDNLGAWQRLYFGDGPPILRRPAQNQHLTSKDNSCMRLIFVDEIFVGEGLGHFFDTGEKNHEG